MEINNNINDKKNYRSKSLANSFLLNLSKEKEKRSSNMFSSISKKNSWFQLYT